MRSAELHLELYGTDKIPNHYLENYDLFFDGLSQQPVVLLELGILTGGSLLLWRDYFPHGKIVGIDRHLPEGFIPGDRISVYQGNQADRGFLTHVASATAPGGYNIIIDDASHIGELTKVAFWHLFTHHLKPGGLYVIEDWGTGYWSDWPDGKSLNLDAYMRFNATPDSVTRVVRILSRFRIAGMLKIPMAGHNYGMVGFIKQLVDEQGASDASRHRMRNPSKRGSMFESMTIMPSIVVIKKSRSAD